MWIFILLLLMNDVEIKRVQIERVHLAQCQERRQQLVQRADAVGWGSKTLRWKITNCEYVYLPDQSQEETDMILPAAVRIAQDPHYLDGRNIRY